MSTQMLLHIHAGVASHSSKVLPDHGNNRIPDTCFEMGKQLGVAFCTIYSSSKWLTYNLLQYVC